MVLSVELNPVHFPVSLGKLCIWARILELWLLSSPSIMELLGSKISMNKNAMNIVVVGYNFIHLKPLITAGKLEGGRFVCFSFFFISEVLPERSIIR